MIIDDIHPVYRSSKRVTDKQLDVIRVQLGGDLPRGYQAFLTRFGHGWINNWLQIYCPDASLIHEQRQTLVTRFAEYTRDFALEYNGAKLSAKDIENCVQIGINQDVMQMFACPRFPGSVFNWEGLDIWQYKTGIEDLSPFAGMRMDQFAYFFPFDPSPEYQSLACKSKRLAVQEVVQAIEDRCKDPVSVIDVDEGPGRGSRTPAFWLFPKKLGVKFHVYGVETDRERRVYLTFGTSPRLLSKVNSVIEDVGTTLDVSFKPARWH